MGRFVFFSLNSLQSERQKGILETEKGFTPKRMYTELKSSSMESQLFKLLLSGPYFINQNFESQCDMLQFIKTNCEFPEQTYLVTALWKTKAPHASSRCFLSKRRTGKSTQNMIWGSKIIRVFVIAAFFRGNFQHTNKMF